jgi:hypothetical protein
VSTLLADLQRTIDPNTVWGRFTGGRDSTVRWYRRVYERLAELDFRGEIMGELERAVSALETYEPSADLLHRDATGTPW